MRSLSACLFLLTLMSFWAQQDESPEETPPLPEGRVSLVLDPGRHTNIPLRVFFSDDSTQLFTVARESIRIWDVASGAPVKVISPPGLAQPRLVAMSKGPNRLALACRYPVKDKWENVVYILSLPDGRLERVLKGHSTVNDAIAITPDGRLLALAGVSGKLRSVKLWDLTREGDSPKVLLQNTGVSRLAFAPDGKRLAWGTEKGGVGIRDLESGEEKEKIQGMGVQWSPDGKTIATVKGNNVRFFDDTGKLLSSNTIGGYKHMTFSPDSKSLLVAFRPASYHHRATLLDVATGKELRTFIPHSLAHVAEAGAISTDGKLAATVGGQEGNNIFIWQTEDGKQLQRINSNAWMSGGAASVQPAWSKDGNRVCWCSWQRGVKTKIFVRDFATFDLVELSIAKTLDKEQRHEEMRKAGYPSPDGRYLMQVDVNRQTLKIVPTAQKKPLLTLYRKGHDWIIWTEEGYYAASPGGEKIVTWQVDNGIDKLPSVYAADRFKKFHRPDVIQKAFALGSVKAALTAIAKETGKVEKVEKIEESLPPMVHVKIVKTEGAKVTVKITAKAQVKSQPVVALRLMLNGMPFPDLPAKRFDKPQAEAQWEQTVELTEGKHTLGAMVRSEDASARAEVVAVEWRKAENLPTLHVVAVGINTYQKGIPALACAVNDATDIKYAFDKVQSDKKRIFSNVETHLLTEDKAKAKDIVANLKKLKTQRDDVVVVFLAGHGTLSKGDFYFLTADSDADAKKLSDDNALSGKKMAETLGGLGCRVLLLLDACHSGAAELKPASDDAGRALSDDEVGVTVLSAAQGKQKAQEKGKNGLFTLAIKEAIEDSGKKPAPRASDGRLFVYHLFAHVSERVGELSDFKQTPFLRLPDGVQPYALRQFEKK